MRHVASEQPERKLGMHPRSLSAGTAWLLHEDAATQAEARLSRQLLFGWMNISRPRAAPRVLYGRRIAGVCCDERWHGPHLRQQKADAVGVKKMRSHSSGGGTAWVDFSKAILGERVGR